MHVGSIGLPAKKVLKGKTMAKRFLSAILALSLVLALGT